MLDPRTKFILSIIYDIHYKENKMSNAYDYTEEEFVKSLMQLEKANLIRHIPNTTGHSLDTYELVKPYFEITLYDLISATGEGIHIRTDDEAFPLPYNTLISRKLSVMNYMIRHYLSEISVADCVSEFETTDKKRHG
ncbi:hypothetical protein [Bacteroides sp.]|uniref:hypothetical protein n=1 Tax=Bacteroides sp. TaxID=29523 RepID=UPI0025BA18BB|nr:hypothetical protein [Bacteroides sp.]